MLHSAEPIKTTAQTKKDPVTNIDTNNTEQVVTQPCVAQKINQPIADPRILALKKEIDALKCLNKNQSVYINQLGVKLQEQAHKLTQLELTSREKIEETYESLQLKKATHDLGVLLGDGRNGVSTRPAQDKLTEKSIDDVLKPISNPLIRLQVLENLFELMNTHKLLYTRQNDKHLFFMLNVIAHPVSGTYQRHLKLLKKTYIGVLKKCYGKEGYRTVLKYAGNSKLIDANRSNYQPFQKRKTKSREEINKMKSFEYKSIHI